MVNVFQLRCRLSTEPIIIMVDYEWKPRACKICKVFIHSYKTLVEGPTLSIEDMLKIKKIKKKIRGALYACNSPVIIAEGVASLLIVAGTVKSVTQTNSLVGTGRQVQPSQELDDWLDITELSGAIVPRNGQLVQTLKKSIDRLKM